MIHRFGATALALVVALGAAGCKKKDADSGTTPSGQGPATGAPAGTGAVIAVPGATGIPAATGTTGTTGAEPATGAVAMTGATGVAAATGTPAATGSMATTGAVAATGAAPGTGATAVVNPSGDTSFSITISAPASAEVGKQTTALVTVKPGAGFHVNLDYPAKLTVVPPAGVTVADDVREKSEAGKLTEQELTFSVQLTATAAGSFDVPGTFKFAVCTLETCDPKKEQVTIKLAVK